MGLGGGGERGREEGGALEGGTEAVVARPRAGGETLLAALWAQPPGLLCLENSLPPAFYGPLVPVWPISPGQLPPHDPLGLLSLRHPPPPLQHVRPP